MKATCFLPCLGSIRLRIIVCFIFLSSFQVFSQTTIVKNEFISTGYYQVNNGAIGLSNGGDNWNFVAEIDNGAVIYNTAKFISPTRSLGIVDYYENLEKVAFNQIDITGFVNIEFSFGYASNNELGAGDKMDLIYYIDGVPTRTTLIQGGNGEVNFGASTNNGTGVTNKYVLNIPNGSTTFNFDIELVADRNGGNEYVYIDDVYLTHVIPSSLPPAANCKNISINLDSNGDANIAALDIDNGSTDDLSALTLSYTIDIDTFDCYNLGANTVILTVTDDEGQTDTCTSIVTVNTYTGNITAPALPDVNAYCEYTVPVPADINYKCNLVTPVFSSSDSDTSDTTFTSSGTIIWFYDDGAGQSTTATQNVFINTLVPPTNIIASAITDNSTTITWDDLLGEETYVIRYKESTLTTWTTVTATTNTINLASLDGLTEYDVEVASACGAAESTYSTTYNFTTLTSGAYCTPVSTSSGTRYITNVTLPGETVDIDNDSGDGGGGGYEDYTNLPAADLYFGESYDISIEIGGNTTLNAGNHRSGWVAYIDFDQDNVFSEGERVYRSGGTGGGEESSATFPFNQRSFTVPTTADSGVTTMRIGIRQYWSPGNPCGTSGEVEDFEDYKVKISLDPFAPRDITLTGNNTEIINGQTATSFSSFTDFGVYDINGGVKTRVYSIFNSGSEALQLGLIPVSLQLGSSTDFSITTQPAAGTIIAPGNSETFSIGFDPSTMASGITAVVIIDSDDPDENPFTYTIVGEGAELYPDTDGDGVSNNFDIDDDNDGISDSEEQLQCLMYSNASLVETEFLNEHFGAGTTRAAINGNTGGVTTTYCYEDGVAGQAPEECDAEVNLNDGEYVVHYSITNGDAANNGVTPNGENIANFAHFAWYKGEDHTPGDTNGRMAVFNGAEDPGVFYETAISGILSDVPINYSFWAINIDNADNRFPVDQTPRINPNITVRFLTPDYSTELASFDTGDITRCTSGNNCVDSVWKKYGTSIVIGESEFVIQFINNSPGGLGNDLALDDIKITQSLCDLDGDGVADVFDLDNDNDGIPNIYEFGPPFLGADIDIDRNGVALIGPGADTNGNGMSDIYETATALDSDNDGTPDYGDLDSDNDSIFDVVENDGQGDLDIDGDGFGDGNDIDSGINNDGFDGDGVLALIDNNDDDADGDDHGLGTNGYEYPLDTDGDGVPDYLDLDSEDDPNDFTNGSDIDTIEIYAHLDADNDGIIDDTTDTDNDGILDLFDTDNTVFGSPRDLDGSYTLFFDGRNDYVEDINVINGWVNATLMAWIKIEPGATGDRIVVGQNSFKIMVTNGDRLKVETNSITLEGDSALPENIWVHVGATYSSVEGKFVIYVNGHPIKDTSVSGALSSDTTNFTIGRTPNTDTNYFEGEIDEVRLFNEALSETSFQRMVYQELSDTNFNQGAIVPLDIDAANTFSTSLIRYFKMDTFKGDIVDDETTGTIDIGTGAKLYNIKNIYFQTAPLPYETKAVGIWGSKDNWLHGDVWDIDAEVTNQDWSIVHVKHSLTTSTRHATAGLIVDAGIELSIQNDVELNNSWYLNLEGIIDLEGESQLIQTEESILKATGSIERDQQGTENLYTYNYWSSPVHTSNPNADIDGDETYTVASVLRDGEDPNNPNSISFVGGYDGSNTAGAVEIADYWIWKYSNRQSDTYSLWQPVKSTGDIKVGEGYTMKGPGTGSIATDKNYVFQGTPNNGTITLGTDAGNDYLVGNPYPSAIDGVEFLNDNPHLDGTLYFWEHYGGGSHILREYQGGYGTYNYSGGVPALDGTMATASPDVSSDGTATKTPKRYIPVGQGFYVTATTTGTTKFENDQRIFVTEAGGTNSVFMRGTSAKSTATVNENLEDQRTKLRLNYNSPNGYIRQLLVTIDENATIESDRGYDAPLIEDNVEDMFWTIGENNFVIQGINEPIPSTTLPLSIKTKTAGKISINLAELNYPTEGFELYIKDNLTDTYHDLISNPTFTTTVDQGFTNNRFEVVFAKLDNTLSISDNEITQDAVSMYYDSSDTAIHIANPDNFSIENITGTNILGQNVLSEVLNSSDKNISLPANLTLGVYIFTIQTDHSTITKKMIIK